MSRYLSAAQASELRVLRLSNFASVFDRFAMPAMLLAIAHDFNVDLVQVGSVVATYFLTYGLTQPLWGLAASRFGALRVLRACTLAGVAATLVAVLAPSFTVLLVSRAIGGAVLGALIPTALIHVGNSLSDDNRHRGVSSLMSANALGTTSATVIAGTVVALFGWRWALAFSLVFVVSAAVGLFLVTFSPLATGTSDSPLQAIATILSNRASTMILALAFAEGAAVHGTLTYVPTVLAEDGLGAGVASSAAVFFGLTVLMVSAVVGRVSGKISTRWLIFAGAIAGAIGVLGLAFSSTYLFAALAAAALGLAWAMCHSSMQTWATQVFPSVRGMMIALFASALFLGNALSALVGGWLLHTGAETWYFVGTAGLLVLVAAVGFGERARWDRARAKA